MSSQPAEKHWLKNDLVLGIETSCDETSAAVIAHGCQILSNVISSQVETHKIYGGVVPEIASRQHLEQLNRVIDLALQDAGVSLQDVGGIAVTCGPGLVGALLIGVSTAKSMAYAAQIPFVGVNHLEGHIMANLLLGNDKENVNPGDLRIRPPALALLVSGGHTELISWQEDDSFARLGASCDDAAGEALDKIARLLGLGYPGGPALEVAAQLGNKASFPLPPVAMAGTLDFSFSGVKTAAINSMQKARQQNRAVEVNDVAAAFQAAVFEAITSKTAQAITIHRPEVLLVAGGVAANKVLRKSLQDVCHHLKVNLSIPASLLCTDNAAMIAAAGYRKLSRGLCSPLSLNAYPHLKLDDSENLVYHESCYLYDR